MCPPLRLITMIGPAWIMCLPTPVPGYAVSVSEEDGVKLLPVRWLSQLQSSLQKEFCADIHLRHFKIRLIQIIYCRTAQNLPYGNAQSVSPWNGYRMQHLLPFLSTWHFCTMNYAGQVSTRAPFGKYNSRETILITYISCFYLQVCFAILITGFSD